MVLLFSCTSSPGEKTRRFLLETESISYQFTDMYLDGGSLGFMFQTEGGQEFVVLLRIPEDEKGHSRARAIVDSSQVVQVTPAYAFQTETAYTVLRESEEEKHLIHLIETASGPSTEEGQPGELTTLVKVIEQRNFNWPGFYEPAAGKGLYEPVELPFSDKFIHQPEEAR